ncbi:hypothetical protein CLIB1444_23S00628 [[Candida] jaroonii]|uniref:Uncharacterized protein n=1 Tax=[Candida] jaroonii TaxID=467808 RepID=A0ACA9YFV2_9ASCO|nr:hypothetical protein CLIB1444_23S00628 [[Candida] jaroonii]
MVQPSVETRSGILTKLGIFSVIAIGIAFYGKSRASEYKKVRHLQESDAIINSRIKSQLEEFEIKKNYPGMNTEEGDFERKSKYVGAGSSYSSRKTGDRFTFSSMWR